MQFNKKLSDLISVNDLDYSRKNLKYWTEKKLSVSAKLIFPKIVEYNSGYYLDNGYFKKNLKNHNLNYSDLTESEWENNEIYLLDNSHDYKILLWKAAKIMKGMKVALQESFANKEFIIIGILNNFDTEPSISIRFYNYRPTELEMIDVNKLDSFQEPIMAIKVN